MRFVIALLLCLSIPLQGWAALGKAEAPCPMGEVAMAQMMASADAAGSLQDLLDLQEDCCNDLATALQTGQACKTGQDCHVPTLWVTSILEDAATQTAGPQLHAPPPSAPLRAQPASVWRPPSPL